MTFPGGIQAIPPTLQQSLTARLDRLGSAREVAQIGAVIGRGFSYPLIRAVAEMDDTALQAALERLAEADILLVQGLPPESEYRFKHALIQDAAYENLLRSRRQVLHRRVGEVLCDQFVATAATEPELLAHHFTQSGLIEAAIEWWGKAGQRSLERSALVEAAAQLTHALNQIDTLPATPALRRKRINFQVSLITPLMHIKGFAASETIAAEERALQLIKQAEAIGEPPEDPLLLFSVLYGFWVASYAASNGHVMRELAARFLALAERQGATAMVGHRLMATSLFHTGEIAEGRAHFDSAIALYDATEHRLLATRFGQDVGVVILSWRALVLWLLGYPTAALAEVDAALENARETEQATTLMYAQVVTSLTLIHCWNYTRANAQTDEVVATADEKGTLFWKAQGMMNQGCVLALTGSASDAVHSITTGITAWRSTGASLYEPLHLIYLAMAYAKLGQLDDARRCIDDAIEKVERSKEKWCEAEVHRRRRYWRSWRRSGLRKDEKRVGACRVGPVAHRSSGRFSNFGSLAMLSAIRRASSRVRRLVGPRNKNPGSAIANGPGSSVWKSRRPKLEALLVDTPADLNLISLVRNTQSSAALTDPCRAASRA